MDSFFFPDAQQLPNAGWASLPFQRLKVPLPEEHRHGPPGSKAVTAFTPTCKPTLSEVLLRES